MAQPAKEILEVSIFISTHTCLDERRKRVTSRSIKSWWAGPFQRCNSSYGHIMSCRFYLLGYSVVQCSFSSFVFKIFLFFCVTWPLRFLVFKMQILSASLSSFVLAGLWLLRDSEIQLSFSSLVFKFCTFFFVTWPLCFQVFSWLVPKMQILSASFISFFLAGL